MCMICCLDDRAYSKTDQSTIFFVDGQVAPHNLEVSVSQERRIIKMALESAR